MLRRPSSCQVTDAGTYVTDNASRGSRRLFVQFAVGGASSWYVVGLTRSPPSLGLAAELPAFGPTAWLWIFAILPLPLLTRRMTLPPLTGFLVSLTTTVPALRLHARRSAGLRAASGHDFGLSPAENLKGVSRVVARILDE